MGVQQNEMKETRSEGIAGEGPHQTVTPIEPGLYPIFPVVSSCLCVYA